MDKRTPAQRKADIAACTLDRLQRIDTDLWLLQSQLRSLGRYAAEHPELGADADPLLAAANGILRVLAETPGDVRDMASRLPLRGLEFGCEAV